MFLACFCNDQYSRGKALAMLQQIPFKLSVNYCSTITRKKLLANVLKKFATIYHHYYCELFFIGNI